ncbi:MAG: hypothetical protein ACREQY_14780, partial [Candidatus Binatia bacterium]
TKERGEHSCCRNVAGFSRPRCGCGHSGETLGGSGDPSLVVKPPSLRLVATVRRFEAADLAPNARGEDPPDTPPPTAATAANAS